MKTDISKLPLKEWKHSLGVFLQMGRLQLDSDGNEQTELSLRLLQRQTEDVVRTGSPNHGFRVDDRILFDAMDVSDRWIAEKANIADPDPIVHVDYFDFRTGTGSLTVSGASALVHKLKAARDFSLWKEIVFAAKGSFADNECTFFLGQGATRGLLTTTRDPGDIDGWRIFRADPTNPVPAVDLTKIDSLGFITNKAKDYQLDFIKIDSPIRQILVNTRSASPFTASVNPGDTAQLKVNDSDRFWHSVVLEVTKVTAIAYELPAMKDLSHARKLIVAVGKLAAPAPSFNVTLTDANNQSVVLAGGSTSDTTTATGVWRVASFPIPSALPFDRTKVVSIQWGGLAPGTVYHVAPVLLESDLQNNLVIMGGDGTAEGAGRFYLDGLAAIKENHETYFSQVDLPAAAPLPMAAPGPDMKRLDLAYLDMWERPITYIEDADIREIALQGPDTCTRLRLIAQVRILKGTEIAVASPNPATAPLAEFNNLPQFGRGVLTTKDKADLVVDACADPCEPAIAGTFLGEENRLFRVEIHKFGGVGPSGAASTAMFKWSRENGAVATALTSNAAAGDFSVIVEKPEMYKVGDLIEIYNDLIDLVTGPYEDTAGHRDHERGEMRKISTITLPDRRISWQDAGSPEPQFHAGLARAHRLVYHAGIRRWDDVLYATAGDIVLADGVVIELGGQDMLPGDYWGFATRVIDRSVERLVEQPPHGILHRYFPLAQISRSMSGGSQTVVVSDIRPHFDALPNLKATDVAYDPGPCDILAGVSNVQQALDAICNAELGGSMADHNKHLHGSGVVCGLQVHCNADRNLITVENGYALDCEGNVIRVTSPIFYKLIQEATALGAIDLAGNGEVWLSMTRGAGEAANLHLEKAVAQSFWKKVLEGTLLEDFYRDCIENLIDFAKASFLPFPSTAIPVVTQQKLIISLINLFWQLLQPATGQYVFLSPAEDKLLHDFYNGLRNLLASKTFCAMFDKLTDFPAYPYTNPVPGIDTAFGLFHFHRRMRPHPAGKLVYTCGTGPKIDVYDVTAKALVASLDFPGGTNIVVQDVAFSNDGLTMYSVAVLNNQDSVFASATINLATNVHTWGATHVVCDLRFVTLGTSTVPPHAGKLYAIGLANGFYILDPNSIPLVPVADVPFNATGMMEISNDKDAAIVAQANGTAINTVNANFNQCRLIRLSAPALTSTYVCSGPDNACDIAVIDTTVYIAAGLVGKQLFRFNLDTGAALPGPVNLNTNSAVRIAPTLDKKFMMASLADKHMVERLNLDGNPPVLDPGFRIPVQVIPIDLLSSSLRNEIYVLNMVSCTVSTVDVAAVFAGPPPPYTLEPPLTLSQYRTQMIHAFTDLTKVLGQYLKDCFCEHFLVDCPDCHRDEKIYLGSIEIKIDPKTGKPEVYKICNFTRRRYVRSEQLMEYWLSAIPIIPILKEAVAELCCKVVMP